MNFNLFLGSSLFLGKLPDHSLFNLFFYLGSGLYKK